MRSRRRRAAARQARRRIRRRNWWWRHLEDRVRRGLCRGPLRGGLLCGSFRRGLWRGFFFLLADDFGEKLLGFLEFGVALLGEVLSGAVDIEVQHAHTGGWPLGGDLLRGKMFGDGRSVLVEKVGLGVGAVGGDACAPFSSGHALLLVG